MKRFAPLTPIAVCLSLAAALLVGRPASAQDPAQLAPADIAVYIHIDQPDKWFADLTQGPLGLKMREDIQTQKGSGDLLAALGMNIDQFMRAYFGGDVVVLGPGGDKDGVIFTEVSPADRAHAITSLDLKQGNDLAGYKTYVGDDGGMVVMLDKWVAMCDASAVEFLEGILKMPATAPRLSQTKRYVKWTTELPKDRAMTMLVSEGENDHHAIGVVRNGASLDATYLGTSPKFDELMGMLGKTSVAEFGPLPKDTIGAVSFNILANDKAKEGFQFFDAMLGGKSFADDVLPKLDAPTLMFMGSVAGDAVTPKVGVEVPVVGLAFKMNDDSVAADLNRINDALVMFANFAVAEFKAGAIPQRDGNYGGAKYRVAEVAAPVAKGIEFPEIAPIQMVYGTIDDYYVVCSQEVFFKQCVDAYAADKTKRMRVEGPIHRLAKTPVLAATGRPDGLGRLVRSWGVMLQKKGLPEVLAGAEQQNPMDFEGLFDLTGMLEQYSLVKMQVWSGDDGLVIGSAQLTAPQ